MTHPQSSPVCGDGQDSAVTADLCSTSDTHTTQKRGARERPITSAIRLLTNDISATPLYGLPGPQAIGKEPRLRILEILWTRMLTLVRLSLRSSEFLAIPLLLQLHNRAAFDSRTEETASP